MKSIIALAVLLSLVFALTGCMSWLYEPTVDDAGNIQYIDETATAAALEAGLIEPGEQITSASPFNEDGSERSPHLSDQLKPGALSAIKAGTGYGDLFFPGLGGLLGSIMTGGLLVLRGRKKAKKFAEELGVAEAGRLLLAKGATVLAQIVKDYKEGKIDTDGDGKLSMQELKDYATELAEETGLNAVFASKLVEIGTSSWSLSQRQTAVEALAASS